MINRYLLTYDYDRLIEISRGEKRALKDSSVKKNTPTGHQRLSGVKSNKRKVKKVRRLDESYIRSSTYIL
jgi:hypothetical protein